MLDTPPQPLKVYSLVIPHVACLSFVPLNFFFKFQIKNIVLIERQSIGIKALKV